MYCGKIIGTFKNRLKFRSTECTILYLPKGPARVSVYFRNIVIEECNQGRNSAQLPRLRFHWVVHITQVLQISSCI